MVFEPIWWVTGIDHWIANIISNGKKYRWTVFDVDDWKNGPDYFGFCADFAAAAREATAALKKAAREVDDGKRN